MPTVQTNILNPSLLLNGTVPCAGGIKGIPVLMDFSLGASFDLDLSIIQQMGYIDVVQTIYVDNSGNANAFTITCGITNQVLTVPGGAQAYLPILQPSPAKINFATGGTPTILIQLLNFYIPPALWSAGNANAAAIVVSDAILDATVTSNRVNTNAAPVLATPTDHSGTITVGGTAQIIIPTNTARKGFTVHNPSTATEILQIKFGTAGGYIDLTAGSTYESGSFVYSGDIYAVGATAGHAFTAYEAS